MHGEVHGRGGVDSRDPHQAAPTDVVPRPVMHDVHRPPVASFPPAVTPQASDPCYPFSMSVVSGEL